MGVEPSAELCEITRRYVESLPGRDARTALGLWSDDSCVSVIGSDPREWVRGPEEIRLLARQVEELEGIQLSIEVIEAWRHGDAGWSISRIGFVTPDGRRDDMRWTLVFVLEAGHWRIVHNHNSIGIANEDALGMTLTTAVDALAEDVLDDRPDVSGSVSTDGTLTVLFSDIENSTLLAEAFGDRRWVELLREYDALLRRLVTSHGGAVVKAMGDGYMCVFPSARSALSCALRMRHVHPTVQTRVGLHVGDVVRSDDDFFGHTVTMAARVASSADGGEVLVSDLVRQLVAGAKEFDFDHRGDVELKGISGTHALYRAELVPA